MDIFVWLEQTSLSVWVRESPTMFAFPAILVFHVLGMGFLAGTSGAIALRILGVMPGMPIAPMGKFYPVMWIAFWVSVVSGMGLLIGYPTKALTNPLFYPKLILITFGMVHMRLLKDVVFRDPNLDTRPVPAKGRRTRRLPQRLSEAHRCFCGLRCCVAGVC